MSTPLAVGRTYTITAHLECDSYAAHERLGSTCAIMADSLRANLSRRGDSATTDFGTCENVRCDVTRNSLTNDVLGLVFEFTPSRARDSDSLEVQIFSSLNYPVAGRLGSGNDRLHQPYWGGHVPTLNVLNPLASVVPSIITSVVPGRTGEQPTSSRSLLGRAANVANTNPQASNDPTRDGRTVAANAATDLGAGAREALLPSWAIPVGIGVAALAGLVVIGYVLSSGARAVEAVKS